MRNIQRVIAPAVAVAVVAGVSPCFATSLIPDIGLETVTLLTDFGTAVGTSMAALMAVAGALLAGMFAWKGMRRLTGI